MRKLTSLNNLGFAAGGIVAATGGGKKVRIRQHAVARVAGDPQ
jgi:hypothetical protein